MNDRSDVLQRLRHSADARRGRKLLRQAAAHAKAVARADRAFAEKSPPSSVLLAFEALEPRVLLSADHNVLAATLLQGAGVQAATSAPPTIDTATTTQATALDALVKPSATALATTPVATVPGSEIQEQTFVGEASSGTASFQVTNVTAGNTLSVVLAPSDPNFVGAITLTDPNGNVVGQQDPNQPLLIDPVTAESSGAYTVNVTATQGAGTFTATVATNATLNQNLATQDPSYHITDLTPSSTYVDGGGYRMAAIGQTFVDPTTNAPTVDGYNVTASKGDVLDISVVPTQSTPDAGVLLDIGDSNGNDLADGGDNPTTGGQSLQHFVVPADGTYTINVFGIDQTTVNYNLVVTRDAQFKIDGSPDMTLSPGSQSIIGHVGDAAPAAAPIEVAVVGAGGAQAIADQLNGDTEFSFDANVITAAQVTAGQLSGYSAVILADTYGDTNNQAGFDAALEQFQVEGGGVVTTPTAIFTGSSFLPVADVGTAAENNQDVTFSSTASPITAGIGTLTDVPGLETSQTLTNGATALATDPSGNIVVAALQPTSTTVIKAAGRSVFLGLPYEDENAAADANAGVRTGAEDQLLEQAVAWAAAEPDGYLINATAGDQLGAYIETPTANSDGTADTLSAQLTLLAPDGSVVSYSGARADPYLSTTASETGTYRLLVSSADNTSGDYELAVYGATGARTAPTAATTDPVFGEILPSAPDSVDVHFSEPLLLGTLDPSALTVNGVAATAIAEHGGLDYTFTIDPSALNTDASNIIQLAAGAGTGIDGLPTAEMNSPFGVGTLPATSITGSSLVNDEFVAAGQPIVENVTFNQPILVQGLSAATLTDATTGATIAPTSVTFDYTTNTATFTYPAQAETTVGALTFALPDGALTDAYGAPVGGGVSTAFTIGTPGPQAVTLTAAGPAGVGVQTATVTGALDGVGTSNAYTFSAVGGQTFSAALTTATGAGASLTLTDGLGDTVATTSAKGYVTLQNLALAGGNYTLTVASLDASAAFSLTLALNAQADGTGSADSSLAAATGLNASTLPAGSGDRLATVGSLDASADSAFYSFSLAAGQRADVVLTATDGSSPTFSLLDGSGDLIAKGSADAVGNEAVSGFTPTVGGTYVVEVSGTAGSAYTLAVSRGAQIATPPASGSQLIDTPAILAGLAASGGAGPIRVAIYQSVEADLGSSAAAAATLLDADTAYDFHATVVTGADIDTVAKLQGYDVVLFVDSDLVANYATFAPALEAWVQGGGNVVATGKVADYPLDSVARANEAATLAQLNAILPVTLSYDTSYQGDVPQSYNPADPTNPITAGLPPLPTKTQSVFTYPLNTGSTSVLTATGELESVDTVVSTSKSGLGRSVYIGFSGIYAASGFGSAAAGLSGSAQAIQPEAAGTALAALSQLVAQSLAYAANVGDSFTLQATASTPLTLSTTTEATGAAAPSTALTPTITLVGPDGSTVVASNSGGATLVYTPTVSGLYKVEVTGNEAGAFVLNVGGASLATPAFTVTGTNQPNGERVENANETYQVTFSNAIDLRSLTAAALTVDGVPAVGFTVVDGRTVAFDTGTSLATEGTHTIALAAGALTDVSGTALAGFSSSIVIDRTSPTVVSTSVDGGFVAPSTVFTVSVTFSEPIDPTSLHYYTSYLENIATSSVLYASAESYDAATNSATFTFTASTSTSSVNPNVEGDYSFNINGGPTDLAGNPLLGDDGQAYTSVTRNFAIDQTTAALPPLQTTSSAAPLVSTTGATGNLYGVGDVDSFTTTVPAGDTLGVAVTATSGNAAATVALLDAGGDVVASATTDANGDVVIPASGLLAGGVYKIQITDTSGSGDYNVAVVANALLNAAASGPASLEPSAQAVTGGTQLAAVGTLGSSKEDDYTLSLTGGQALSVALGYPAFVVGSTQTADLTLTLVGPDGTVLTTGTASSEAAQSIADFTPTTTGTYTIKVGGDAGTTFDLVATRGLGLYANSGQTLALGASALGSLGATAGSARPTRVLVYGAGAASEAATLNADAYGAFTATAAAVGSVSTVAQLQSYDLVVLATNGSDAADPAFSAALREWVQQDGGSLIALGAAVYWKGATNPDIEAVLPVDLTNSLNYGEGELLLQTTDTSSPISQGVTFPYSFEDDYVYALPKPGADNITNYYGDSDDAVVVSENVGLGRSVFLGGDITRLVEQAALYAVAGHSADTYSLSLTAGQTITLATTTPPGGAGNSANALQPTLELVDPSGIVVASGAANAPDGQNASLTFAVLTDDAGLYTLRVLDANGAAGAYVVSATSGGTATTGTPAVQPTAITTSSSLAVNELFPISWSVANTGTAVAEGPWTDTVYLSSTPTLGAGAISLGSVTHSGTLGLGQIYNAQLQAALPGTVTSGLYYLIVKTSGPDTLAATQTYASQPITVTAGLTLAATAPTEAIAGHNAAFSITLTNQGAQTLTGAVLGDFGAFVYLTTDPSNPLAGVMIGSLQSNVTTLAQGQSATATGSFNIPNLTDGPYYVAFAYYSLSPAPQGGSQQNNYVGFAPQTLQLDRVEVSNVTGPATANSGTPASVSWTLTNPSSTVDVTDQITDNVYVSTDAAGDNPTLVGTFNYFDGLTPGQSITRTQSVTPPALTAGTYYFFVTTTDYANGVIADTSVAASPTTFGQVAPNLVVSSVTPPQTLASSEPVTVQWTVANIGNSTTGAQPWVDNVYLSASATLNANSILLGSVANQAALAPGQSYQSSLTGTLPNNISGAYYIIVDTDANNQVFENLNEGDNTTAIPVTVTLTPPPDLQVTTVTAPSSTFSGQSASVSWTVTNAGQGPTLGSEWADEIYLSSTPTLTNTSKLLDTIFHESPLASGASYTVQDTVSVPVGISGPYYFVVVTNANGEINEGVNGGNDTTAEPTPTNILLTPPPDLVATIISAPATGLAGGTVAVNYSVANDGSTTTPNTLWTDAVYISQNQTLDSTATLLGTIIHGGALAPGGSYTTAETFTLPNGISGNDYILVDADQQGQVFELDKTNNVAASTIAVTSNPPSLAVSNVTAPITAATGQSIQLSYTVVNNGGSTLPIVDSMGNVTQEGFMDEVVLTDYATGVKTVIDSIVNEGLIAAGGSYTNSEVVQLPYLPTGAYALTVVAGSDMYQAAGAANTSSAQPFTLTAAGPDLTVTGVTAPTALEAGTPTTITWTDSNIGQNPTDSNYWYDNVYVSTSATLSNSATLLGSFRQSSALAAGASVSGTLTTSLPLNFASGTYYVLVQADGPHGILGTTYVTDSNRSNNVAASSGVTVTANPLATEAPDLAVTGITAPPAAVSGQQINLGWTIANQGDADAVRTGYDTVYLSLDNTLDTQSDVYLGSLPDDPEQTGQSLAPGASITQTGTFKVPVGLSGDYHVFVVADAGRYNPTDPNFQNNIGETGATVSVGAPQPIDLSIDAGSITVPTNALAGSPISVTYTVNNLSGNNAVGSWTDTLYLSQTGTFDPSDPLLGSLVHTGGLTAGGSYTATLTAPLPGVDPGNYQVIVRTNILDNVPETTLANNIAASVDSTSVDYPELTLGTAATGVIEQNQAAYYKVTVDAGQALSFTLTATSGDPSASSAIYVKYGAAPTANDADFSAAVPFTDTQTVTVPTTEAGVYYIEVVGQNNVGEYSLTAQNVPFSITEVDTTEVGNAGTSTLHIGGALFTANTAFSLVGADGTTIATSSVDLADPSNAYASFYLVDAPVQAYTLMATDSGQVATAMTPIDVIAGQGFVLGLDGATPPAVRVDKPATFTLTYSNTGDQDMLAPLLIVSTDDDLTFGVGNESLQSGPVYLLGASTNGPAQTLRPGESQAAAITYEALIGEHYKYNINYTAYVSTDTGYDISDADWASLEAGGRPDGLTDAQWDTFFASIKPYLGTTWGDLDTALNTIMTEVSPAGGPPIQDLRGLFGAMYAISPTYNPFPSLSGTLLSATDGTPYAGQEIDAFLKTSSGLVAQGSATTDANGNFSITNVPVGDYEFVLADDSLGFDQARDGTTTGNEIDFALGAANASGLIYYIEPVDPTATIAQQSNPILVNDSAGGSHMLYVQDGALWDSDYTGSGWGNAAVIQGTAGGNNFQVASSSTLIDGTQAGLIVTFDEGGANSNNIYYVVGKLDPTTGSLDWSAPVQLTTNGYDNAEASVVVGKDGSVSVAYVTDDATLGDSPKLYFQSVSVASSNLTFADVTANAAAEIQAAILQGLETEAALISPDSGGAGMQFSYESPELDIPGLGKAKITIGGTEQNDHSDTAASLTVGAKITVALKKYSGASYPGTVSEEFGFSFTYKASWDNNICKPKWVFKSGELALTGSATVKFAVPIETLIPLTSPAYLPLVALRKTEALTIDATVTEMITLAGSVSWTKQGPPEQFTPPTGGNVKETFSIGVGVTSTVAGGSNVSATGTITGEATILPNVVPTKLTGTIVLTGDLKIPLPDFDKKGGIGGLDWKVNYTFTSGNFLTSDAPLATASDAAALPPGVSITLSQGTVYSGPGHDYSAGGAAAIDPDILTNTEGETQAALATAPNGDIVAAWVESLPDSSPDDDVVMTSTYDGTAWSTPVQVAGSAGTNDAPVITFDQNGNAVIVWSHVDTTALPDVAAGAVTQAFLDAYEAELASSRMQYAVVSGGNVSAAQTLADLPGSDDTPAIALVNGTVYATWLDHNTGTTTANVEVATWNGTSWSTPTQVATGVINGTPSIASVGGQATIAFAQNVSPTPASSLVSQIETVSLGASGWSAAAAFAPISSSSAATAASASVASAGTGASLLAGVESGLGTVISTGLSGDGSDTPIQSDANSIQNPNELFGPPHSGGTDCDTPPPPPNKKKPNKPPGGGGGAGGGSASGQSNTAGDPNDMTGPIGYGDENYVSTQDPLQYRIDFENEPTASAAAQEVVITTQLDPSLDPRTFRLTGFGFGSTTVSLDGTQSFYSGVIDLSATKGYVVDVTADVNVTTGLVTWTFQTIDPATGQPPTSPDVGFLPLDDAAGDGEGFVSYSVKAKTDAVSGTLVSAKAQVIFDVQPPMDTITVSNTLDAAPPTATVTALAATQDDPNFTVSWSGSDEVGGSSIANYTIYVSDDGGAYTAWQTETIDTSDVYAGAAGHTYSFYVVATDNTGNTGAAPSGAQATTKVAGAMTGTIIGGVFDDANGNGQQDTGELGLAGVTVYIDADNSGAYAAGDPTTVTDSTGSYTFAGLTPGLYAIGVVPPAGEATSAPLGEGTVTVIAGETDPGPVFGEEAAAGTISGTVFNDANANGVQDSGEAGLGGVTVYLTTNGAGALAAGDPTTVTAANGSYSFTDLTSGSYTVQEVVPTGDAQTTPAAPQTVTLGSNVSATASPIGDVAYASVSGTVFNDLNGDGAQETGEPGLAGWTVFVDANNDGVLDNGERSTVTNASGAYTLSNLLPGSYAIDEVAPAGWVQTSPQGTVAMSANAQTDGADVQLVLPTVASAAGAPTSTLDPDNQLAASLTGLDAYRADPQFAAYQGAGLSVAVIDTGIDASSPYFGVEQNGVATKIAFQYDFADGTTDGSDVGDHGSNVASIIAGNDGAYQGVAPDASLDNLKVFSNTGTGNFAYVSDALQWVLANYKTDHIAAVSMALGDGDDWTTAVSRDGIGAELAALAADDVIVVAAAGNNFYTFDSQPGVSYPASDPNVIAVGAVWDGNYGGPWTFASGAVDYATAPDQIASFSQRGPLVDTYAPGAILNGASATGGSVEEQGTSQAEAFITGVATLAQDVAMGTLGHYLTPAEFAKLLAESGTPITDNATDENVTPTGGAGTVVNVERLAQMIVALGSSADDGTTDSGSGTTLAPSAPVVAASASHSVTLTAGEALSGVNFGDFADGTISGTVFADANDDGAQDGGEAGAAGQTVFVDLAGTGVLAVQDPTAVTDANGHYAFTTAFGPGAYKVDLVIPTGESLTTPVQTITMTSGLAATANFGLASPPAPKIATLVDDTGVQGDGITRDATVTLAGTAALGSTVTLFDGTTAVGSGIANATTGAFQITTSALANGPHSLTATATDPVTKLTSPVSAAFPVTVDTTVPQGVSAPVASASGALTFALTFTEPLAELSAADLALTATGTASGVITGVTVAGSTYTVTVGSLSGTGTLALSLAAGSRAQNAAGSTATLATSTSSPVATGPDTLVLRVSEDAYLGDAQFTVAVDGVQIGGVQTATASHADGAFEDITLNGSFGAAPQAVTVTFLNDLYGGTPQLDRNLYVTRLTIGGKVYAGALATGAGHETPDDGLELDSNGSATFDVAPPTTGPDTLTLQVAGDSYLGDPEFTVAVDGVQIGGVQIATASYAAGAWQDVTLQGDFGSDPKAVTVTFINDLYAGTPQTDRNLYVNSLTLNGTTYAGALATGAGIETPSDGVELDGNGLVTFDVAPPATGPDTLTLKVAGDSYLGDPEFTVAVDGVQIGGVQIATASYAAGAWQDVTLQGDFGSDPKAVTVKFINDLWAGTPQTDRNLYVESLTLNGTTYAGSSAIAGAGQTAFGGTAEILSNGAIVFDLTPPAGPDTLTLQVAADSYEGDPEFTVSVNGTQVGGVQTASASFANGQSQSVTLKGDFGAGPKAVTVTFLNDFYAGTPQTDRNLYVDSVTLDGVTVAGASATPVPGQNLAGAGLELNSNSTATFAFNASTGTSELDAPLAVEDETTAAKPHLGRRKGAAAPTPPTSAASGHSVYIDTAAKVRDVALSSGSAASAATWHKAAVSGDGRRRPNPVSIILPAA